MIELIEKQNAEGKCGFVDRHGRWVIDPLFDEVYDDFSEGLVWARVGKKLGFIDILGEWIIAPSFDDAWHFRKGVAAVKYKDKWGFINKVGEWIIYPVADEDADKYYCAVPRLVENVKSEPKVKSVKSRGVFRYGINLTKYGSAIWEALTKLGYDKGDDIPYFHFVECCEECGINAEDLEVDKFAAKFGVSIG